MARKAAKKKPPREIEPPVNDFTANHGDYRRESDDAKAKEGKSTLVRNRHVTTVERWKTLRLLTDTQARAIEYCEELWDKAETSRPLVADLLRIPGMPGGNGWTQQEALDELHALKSMIPTPYWAVFELVCRWDEPGGTAGSRWANDNGRATQAALVCVQFVGDLIAQWRRL